MTPNDTVEVPLPDPDTIRARIDQVDREGAFLRKLLRLVIRSGQVNPQAAPPVTVGPGTRVKLHEAADAR